MIVAGMFASQICVKYCVKYLSFLFVTCLVKLWLEVKKNCKTLLINKIYKAKRESKEKEMGKKDNYVDNYIYTINIIIFMLQLD